MGRAVINRLLATGTRPLIASVRANQTDLPAEVRTAFIGDLNSYTDWSSCLLDVEVVIHCAGRAHVAKKTTEFQLREYFQINFEGTLALARQAAKAGVQRFVYISTIKVNGERTKVNAAFRADDFPSPEDAYGMSKLEAERGLMALARETNMEVVIIRPPLIYGPGVKGNFYSMVQWVRKGLPLPLGAVHNKRSLIALENLVDFIVLCSESDRSPQAVNEVFLISDGEDISTTELIRKVALAYKVKPLLPPIPVNWIQIFASLLGKEAMADRLLSSLVVDASKTIKLLGWRPIVSIEEQLKEMALHDSHS